MNNDIYALYIHQSGQGKPAYKYAGRFVIKNNSLKIEEDLTGLLKEMLNEGEVTPGVQRQLMKIGHSSYMYLQSYTETLNNMKEAENDSTQFDFYPTGNSTPQKVKFKNGVATLNGHPLSEEELDLLVEKTLAGKGIIRFSN